MTPNRVILIRRQYAKAGPLTPDLLSVTCGGKGVYPPGEDRNEKGGERERERKRGAVQCQAHYDPLKTRAALQRGAIHHSGLSNQHVCHCN